MTTARNQQGSALIIVLVIVMVLASLAAFMISDGFSKWRTAEDLMEKTKALHMAEAGLDRAIAEINAERSGNLGTEANPVLWAGGSYFTVAVNGETDGIDNDVDGLTDAADVDDEKLFYTITSTGTGTGLLGDPNARFQTVKRVMGLVKREPLAGFTTAMFGDKWVTISGGSTTDSYDSKDGPYNPANPREHGDVGTNGAITVQSDKVSILGSLLFGFGIPIPEVLENDSRISGTVTNLLAPVELPPKKYEVPAGAVPIPARVKLGGTWTYTLDNNSYVCAADFKPQNGDIIKVTGKVVLCVEGSITLQTMSYFLIAPDASLEIRNKTGDHTIHIKADVPIKPQQALIFSEAATTIKINAGANSYGSIYAPSADVTINGNGTLYGAITGQTIKHTGGAAFHYDEALGRLQIFATGPCKMKAWNETTR